MSTNSFYQYKIALEELLSRCPDRVISLRSTPPLFLWKMARTPSSSVPQSMNSRADEAILASVLPAIDTQIPTFSPSLLSSTAEKRKYSGKAHYNVLSVKKPAMRILHARLIVFFFVL